MNNNTCLHAFKTNIKEKEKPKSKTLSLSSNVFKFINLKTDKEKEEFLNSFTVIERDDFLNKLVNELGDDVFNLTNVMKKEAELIKEQKKKINKEKCKELLKKVELFDESDIRLIHECEWDNDDAVIDARWCEDHIEIFTRKWGWRFPPAHTREYIEYVLNHEFLHQIIYKIMLEDEIYFDEYDGHWAYYAGEIDMLHGISASNTHRDFFESIDSIKNTVELLPDAKLPVKIDFSKWSYV